MNSSLNYSPLKPKNESAKIIGAGHKEIEPKLSEPLPIRDQQEQESEKTVESKLEPSSQPPVEVIPELPEIDQELLDEGVEIVDHDTLFVSAGRKIDLPMPLESVDKGLKKPITNGWRWIAELTRYILAKFGIKIKKDGQKYKLVEQH